MKTTAIIPARYASTRFPGKPLATIGDRPMVVHTWQRVCAAGLDRVVVATDDARIEAVCLQWGAEVVRTRPDHPSGTDRVAEAAKALHIDDGLIINVQGDEPFIDPDAVRQLADFMQRGQWPIGTLACRLQRSEELFDPNVVKVVFGESRQALYFSRAPIPHVRGVGQDEWLEVAEYYKHIGTYAFQAKALQEVARLPKGKLETAESLEQLRWLAHGYRIGVLVTEKDSVGIDTPEDLERLTRWQGQEPKG